MRATYHKHILRFKTPGGTSRGILKTKETWFLIIKDKNKQGIGECGILRSLSVDDRSDYEEKLQWTCDNIHLCVEELWKQLMEFPSIQFGVEMAFRSLQSKNTFLLFPSAFTNGEASIAINGLVWMGDPGYMKNQIEKKIASGFTCIKLKIGAIDFNKELEVLSFIRKKFSKHQIEIRVDANGAFTPDDAMTKLKQLRDFDLHSIEQPIAPGQFETMRALCQKSPLAIALDEELIGVFHPADKKSLLQNIHPQYIILKPSLIGGYKGTAEWISIAESLGISWWITSALESNIGLNAIAQFTYTLQTKMPQGLGTGGLFTNNIESPLFIKKGKLSYDPLKQWQTDHLI